ncbi:hypothetical protein [uncultured Roseobacter sp.]|uniref:hypothetical protein n=1 Tax=uncultured Roseobacter sp. TaxID=114847 RepID=UPI002615FBAE|nr:hypothetical protein [uncultured Roseobacter sp.]
MQSDHDIRVQQGFRAAQVVWFVFRTADNLALHGHPAIGKAIATIDDHNACGCAVRIKRPHLAKACVALNEVDLILFQTLGNGRRHIFGQVAAAQVFFTFCLPQGACRCVGKKNARIVHIVDPDSGFQPLCCD